jgi:hypothetical protein
MLKPPYAAVVSAVIAMVLLAGCGLNPRKTTMEDHPRVAELNVPV